MSIKYERLAMVAQVSFIAATISAVILWFVGCGGPVKQTPVIPVKQACADGTKIGGLRTVQCPAGQTGSKTEVCQSGGVWALALDNCKTDGGNGGGAGQPTCVSFEQVKPILTKTCVSCHQVPQPFDRYDVAKGLAVEFLGRINLGTADARRMPKFPNQELSYDQKQVLQKWSDDGLKEKATDCGNEIPGVTFSLDYVETAILNDISKVDPNLRGNIRYAISAHKNNAGEIAGNLRLFGLGIQKTLNSVSQSRDLSKVSAVDKAGTVWRIDLSAFKLNAASWNLILTKDPFKFVSNTTKGQLIQQLTGTNQPWLHSDNLVFAANNNQVYNALTAVPATRAGLFAKLGVDFQGAFDQAQVTLSGFNGSPISLNKNRLLTRVDTNDGYLWLTFDPVAIANVPQRNLFQFPLIPETRGQALFDFAASEFIFTMPNGMQGYALYNAAQQAQLAAPLNVVHDTQSPFQDEIDNGISCHRCHNSGLIPSQDQIKDHVVANASQFNANDVELVKTHFKGNQALAATYVTDNNRYAKALQQLGISPNDPDPVNFLADSLRRDKTVQDVAGFLFLSEDEFKQGLNGSAQGKAQVGQLLSGGTITLDQLIVTLPILVQDLRIGEDE